ncbi:MAG: c-type cytochrome [Planctomycetales bacterium]
MKQASKQGWSPWGIPLLAGLFGLLLSAPGQAEELPYKTVDPRLQVLRIDQSETESFLSLRADSQGRLFVGGRETLSVLDIDSEGKLQPRKELLKLPKDSWINDIEIRGNDLYLLTVAALYVVPEARLKRDNLEIKRLVWGVPLGHVHQGFHGLAWGPEGDLYLSLGDQLWYYGDFGRPDHWGHWNFYAPAEKPTQEQPWTAYPYNGAGGVFRCRPDGTKFQVVARGLRNPCGLVFDHAYNLFSNENDHEGMPAEYVPGKLLHVFPHANFFWPRGWMPEKTPDRLDLLQTMTTEMGRAVPVGQSYYDEEFLPEEYRHSLLLARWCTRKITYYPLIKSDATFKTSEKTLLEGRDLARPMGVTVGRGGRIFATVSYMAQNEGSPIYKSDLVLITTKDDSLAHAYKHPDLTLAPVETVYADLSLKSWRLQDQAHQEILRRDAALFPTSYKRLDKVGEADPAWGHLLWLTAAGRTPEARRAVDMYCITDDVPNIQVQAIRSLIEFFPDETTRTRLIAVLDGTLPTSGDLQVKQAALLGLFDPRIAPELPVEPLTLAEAARKHSYIRQPLATLIAERGSLERINRMCANKNTSQRLIGVLAAGFRLTVPQANWIPDAKLPLQPWHEPGNYLIQYADAKEKVDLGKLTARIGTYTVADHWKITPHTSEQESLFSLLLTRLNDPEESIRLQSAYFLSLLNDARSEPQVLQVRRKTAEQRLNSHPLKGIARFWTVGPFPDGDAKFAAVHPPQQAAINLDDTYPAGDKIPGDKTPGDKKLAWQQPEPAGFCNFRKIYGDNPHSSYYAYTRLESPSQQTVQLLLGSDDGVQVWLNGREVWKNDISRAALPLQDVVIVDLQPGSNDLLIRVQNDVGESGLHLHVRAEHAVSDVLPEKLGLGSLAERLKQAAGMKEGTTIDPRFASINWPEAVAKGNVEQGRKLFSAMGLGCAKCHGLGTSATNNAGPEPVRCEETFYTPLSRRIGVAPEQTDFSRLQGDADRDAGGKPLTGLIVGETADKVDLLLSTGERLSIPKSNIEERKLLDTSPMPTGLVRTPEELADVLAYLLSEKSP